MLGFKLRFGYFIHWAPALDALAHTHWSTKALHQFLARLLRASKPLGRPWSHSRPARIVLQVPEPEAEALNCGPSLPGVRDRGISETVRRPLPAG